MTPDDLRWGWLVLGALLLATLLPSFSITWLALAGVPWLAGTAVLWHPRLAQRAAAQLAQLAAVAAARRAILVLCVVGVLIAAVFSPAAALYTAVWAGAGVLLLGSMHRAASLPDLIVGTAVAAVATTSSLGALEALLRTHWVAATLGTPQEINAWAYKRADQLWRRNIFRFRSTHETVARRAGVKRVFVAGDSYTFGDKVAETDSTWPARLERKFNQAHPEQRFEVINSAFVGYTTANEAELLRRLGWQFNPDLVVVQFYTNDALPSAPGLQHGGDDMFDPRTPLLPRRFRTGAVQSSALLFVVERKVAALTAPSAVRDAIIHSFDEGSLGWQQLREALREIGDSSRARGTPVVFMMFPTFFEGEHTAASYPFRSIVDKVSAVATQAGFDVLDLTSAFAAEGGDWKRWWVTPYDAHPSSAAHEVAARALISHLEQRGWPASEPLPASSVQPVHHVVTD